MADYPEWVLRYKGPGLYVTKRKNGSYGLFRGHSERVEGKKWPQLKCDEYIGTITEKDGLVPSRPSVKGIVEVYEYGLWALYDRLCGSLREVAGFYGQDRELLFRRAFLKATGNDTGIRYGRQWISVHDGTIPAMRQLDDREVTTVSRLSRQLASRLKDRLGDDERVMRELAEGVHMVHVNGKYMLSGFPEGLGEFLEKHGTYISFEGGERDER